VTLVSLGVPAAGLSLAALVALTADSSQFGQLLIVFGARLLPSSERDRWRREVVSEINAIPDRSAAARYTLSVAGR
jgi:hypothetical protein